jgi:probable addiction module antidote protein
MALDTKPFDPAEYLDDQEALAAYLTEAFETGDPAFIADSLGVVARAVGMANIAKTTGLSRESLYRSLSPEGNPELGTVLKVMGALGVSIQAIPAHEKHDEAA